MQLNPFSSSLRPALGGRKGSIASAHPLATAAGQQVLASGGSAIDAVIAAQAMLAVVSPDACGLGGDGLVLVHAPGQNAVAINGAGASAGQASTFSTTGGNSVAVPGLVASWSEMHARWGCVDFGTTLAPAIEAAEAGVSVSQTLASARHEHTARLLAGGAEHWDLMKLEAGANFQQPALARTLRHIAANGAAGFYAGTLAADIARAVKRAGGALNTADLAKPAVIVAAPITLQFGPAIVHVQPPASQGILLAMALQGWLRGGYDVSAPRAHLGVELTQAAFSLRNEVAQGVSLLGQLPDIDPKRAAGRGGPRAYLHTAGVSAADANGLVASSLVSVFDDFGSAVFVPEGGFCLNNRAGGFTAGGNAFAPGKRPIHTLAPIIIEMAGNVVAMSTPGADGQVQTLLQILLDWLVGGRSLPEAVAAPRWRSENNRLLVEAGHPARDDLIGRGHDVVDVAAGDMRFGAITMAGIWEGQPFALADWRRMTWAGVA